jgi:hypothetical protein
MKGEKGICIIGVMPNQVRRTKFDTMENIKMAYDSHIGYGYIPRTYVIYKCKVCGMFHFGKPEWAKQFGETI